MQRERSLSGRRASQSGPVELRPLPWPALLGFGAALTAVVLIGAGTYRSLNSRVIANQNVTHTMQVVQGLQSVLSTLKDAETGQRGYLLTGSDSYLEPYNVAAASLDGELAALRQGLATEDATQQQKLDLLKGMATAKMGELGRTVSLNRSGDHEGALAVVRTNYGKEEMDRIRNLVSELQDTESRELAQRLEMARQETVFALYFNIGSCMLLLVLIGSAAVTTSREFRSREMQAWIRAGQAGFSQWIQGEWRPEQLADKAIGFLAHQLGAQVGTLYMNVGDGQYRRIGAFALDPAAAGSEVQDGDGLLGQAAKDNRVMHVREVPAGHLTVSSSLGRSRPQELLIAPAAIDGVVQGVVELGFVRRIGSAEVEFIGRVAEMLAAALRSAKDRLRLEDLLEETQRQAEELQTQQEELLANNEQIEQRNEALRHSQVQLEAQQAELEQSNSQMEEQMQTLESQRDRLTEARSALSAKANELERANQYKSEFLANMSHELRSPLNSALILATLLAENRDGNLSEEQVKFARTIMSAGNDLLALINDILDLAKIEAGGVELSLEPVGITALVESMVEAFEPQARQKGLQFSASAEPGVPETVLTDAKRLGQIVKNLLSNALKFTDSGEVSLRVFRDSDHTLAFAVRDTGIGIPPDRLDIIFEAFRQADGSIHRKHGGTGLGLTISRDLGRLLGGDVAVQSTPGNGSVFTVSIPLNGPDTARIAGAPLPAPAVTPPAQSSAVPLPAPETETVPALLPAEEPSDDRDRLDAAARLILVVEDDFNFAAILRDLARELGYQCVLAHTAQQGLEAALRYKPSAVLLDLNLPDRSGLGMLDQLQSNPATRQIPVHVVSAVDFSKAALELGAIGYALKPVQREELVTAFRRLESRFPGSIKRVLVVEDDETERNRITGLISSDGVLVSCAATAAAALQQIRGGLFDCVVLDLNLPDYSGFDLLQRLSEVQDQPFPPVIVHTGRTLDSEEEHRLRRYSRSIIVKDARAPQRLLDEVTLFIHQLGADRTSRQAGGVNGRLRDGSLQGRRILVVEDDVRNVYALSGVLEPQGATVVIARNGREALNTLRGGGRDNRIDLVLMDIMMPEMDGLTAMREIRAQPQWKTLPIIALTAKAMKSDYQSCLTAGASDYIAKPLDVDKLLSLIRVWMPGPPRDRQ